MKVETRSVGHSSADLTLDDSVDSKQNVCDHPVIIVHLVSIGTPDHVP